LCPKGVERDLGGVSVVHLVKARGRKEYLVTKRQVARDEHELEGLIDEAAAWRQVGLSQRGAGWPRQVVELIDVFVDPADMSIVFLMEFCARGMIPRQIPESDLGRVAVDVSVAAETILASDVGPCHGNIGYDTVMVGADGVYKLGGFGAGRSHVLQDPRRDLDEKYDVLCIGRLLLELMTGRRPKSTTATVPASVNAYSPPMVDLVNAALDPNPNSRVDLTSFRERLAEMMNGKGQGEEVHVTDRASRWTKPSLGRDEFSTGVVSDPGASTNSIDSEYPGRKPSLMDVLKDPPASVASKVSKDATFSEKPSQAVAEFVDKVTDEQATGLNFGALKQITQILQQNEDPNLIFKKLFKRPISKQPIVAFKSLCLIHHLMVSGPAEFIFLALRQDKFLEWVQSSWSRQAIQDSTDAHPDAFLFAGGEIAFFAAFLRMKARFHHRSQGVWNGDWSRTSQVTEDGKDPLTGRQRKILGGILEVLETAEELVLRLLAAQDSGRAVKIACTPSFAKEISSCYAAVLKMIDGIASLAQRRKLEESFISLHAHVKRSMDAIMSARDAASRCEPALLLKLGEDAPNVTGVEQPSPSSPPQLIDSQNEGAESQEIGATEYQERVGKKVKKKKNLAEAQMDHEQDNQEKKVADGDQATNGMAPQDQEEALAGGEASSMAMVVHEENQFGNLLNLEVEPPPPPPPEQPRADPGLSDLDLLAGMLGESSEAAQRLRNQYLALPAPGYEDEDGEDQYEQESYQQRRPQFRTDTMEMAIIAVQDMAHVEKLHPSFCQCSMCQATEAVQQFDLDHEDEEESDGAKQKATINLKAKLPTEYEIDPKLVKLGDKLGGGGFGAVYRGKYKGKNYAVKVLAPEVLRNKHAVKEFKSEIKILAAVDHPNILKFVGAWPRPPQFMILTEFAPRGTLFDVLYKGQVQLNWVLQKRIALDICRGMEYLHASGLLHRDLKSTNLMLDTNFNVKIGDFGIARLIEEDDRGHAGTYQYMAPEVIAREPFTEKSDVYAFAMVLWEIMARQLPFYGMDPQEVAQNVLYRGLRPPMPMHCPQPVAVLIDACWSHEPYKRPSFTRAIEVLSKLPG